MGRIARTSVFDDHFAINLLMLVAPLLVLMIIVTLLHRVDAPPKAAQQPKRDHDESPSRLAT